MDDWSSFCLRAEPTHPLSLTTDLLKHQRTEALKQWFRHGVDQTHPRITLFLPGRGPTAPAMSRHDCPPLIFWLQGLGTSRSATPV